MQCPVCKKTCNQNETFCSQCSWEFKIFVGGAPPEEEQRLKIAKCIWQQMLSGVTSNSKPVKKAIQTNLNLYIPKIRLCRI